VRRLLLLLHRHGALLQVVRNDGWQGRGVLHLQLMRCRLLARSDPVLGIGRLQLVLELVADERLIGLLEARRVFRPERGRIHVGPQLVIHVRRVHPLARRGRGARRRTLILVVQRRPVLLRLHGRLYDLRRDPLHWVQTRSLGNVLIALHAGYPAIVLDVSPATKRSR